MFHRKLKTIIKLLGTPSFVFNTTEAYKIYTILSCEVYRVPLERANYHRH